MKICPRCEAGYPDELTTCPLHGGLLSEIRELRPGMLVRNTYRILRKLSKGGMASVYLAQHVLLDEPQVLKFLSSDLSRDTHWASRFLREVRSLRQIRHKNVVQAGNLEPAEDGTLFFSMEYVEGPDLHEFYRRSPKPFDIEMALELAHGIAEGLGAAHAVGVVHRDIKPENILIGLEGDNLVPKIADFGIVATRNDSRLTQSGNALLTPQFAAPEQWLGKRTTELDGRTDLYALGGLLFELITGRSAFHAENYNSWAQQHLHSLAPAPSIFRPEIKKWRGLDELTLGLLAKDPNDRPADVAEVLRLLEAIEYVSTEGSEIEDEATQETGADVFSFSPADATEPPQEPALTGPMPVAIDAGDVPATPAATPQHRAQFVAEPLKAWGPMQPRSAVQPRIQAQRKAPLYTWIVAAAVLIVLAFAAKKISVNHVRYRVLVNQKDAIFSVVYASDGLGMASASRDGTIQFWNLPDARPLGTIAGTTTSLAFSPDGHTIAAGMGDDSINIWDAAHGVVLGTMTGHSGTVAAVAFSPDGKTLASASWDRTVRLWDVASGRMLRTLNGNADRVLAIAWSPDGHILASAGSDQTIRLWDPGQGSALRVLRGHTRAVNSIAFSPDGRTLVSASDDLTIKLWSVSTDQPVRTFKADAGPVLTVAMSPDGRTLVSGSADMTVQLWNLASGRLLRVLKGHTGPVLSVAFSPLGDTVASGSADKTIRLWEVAGVRE